MALDPQAGRGDLRALVRGVLGILLLCAIGVGGCQDEPEVEVAMLGEGAALTAATPAVLDDLLGVAAEEGESVDDGAWPRCTTRDGSHALLAHPDAVKKGVAPSDLAYRVLVTDNLVAVDRPGAPCTRVLGAAPPDAGVVLVSARELRNRCSSAPLAELVARVAAHELGHAMGVASGDGLRCDERGCHCPDPDCLMADERGGCPDVDAELCARCAGR